MLKFWSIWILGIVALIILIGSIIESYYPLMEDLFFLLVFVASFVFSVFLFRTLRPSLTLKQKIIHLLLAIPVSILVMMTTLYLMAYYFPSVQEPIETRVIEVNPDISINEVETAIPDVSKPKERVYPITDGKTFRITVGREYICEHDPFVPNRTEQILEVIYLDTWKEVYKTPIETNCYSAFTIGDTVRVSPNGKYVEFVLWGYEWGENRLVNVETKKSIFPKETHSQGLVWSPSGKRYAFVTILEEFGGTGSDNVWVSGDNLDHFVSIFDLKKWAGGNPSYSLDFQISDPVFIDEDQFEFSVTDQEYSVPEAKTSERYRYDFITRKLKKMSVE